MAAVLEKARELDVPKEIVDRNIKKASEKGQEDFIEKFYEVYGVLWYPSGCSYYHLTSRLAKYHLVTVQIF